ncbi:membrane protein, partial [Candidatus Magnetomorum sp. HK-1]
TFTYNITTLQLLFFIIISNCYLMDFIELDLTSNETNKTGNIIKTTSSSQAIVYISKFLPFIISIFISIFCIFIFYFFSSALISFKIELSNVYNIEIQSMEEYYYYEDEENLKFVNSTVTNKNAFFLFKNKRKDIFLSQLFGILHCFLSNLTNDEVSLKIQTKCKKLICFSKFSVNKLKTKYKHSINILLIV